MKQKIWRAVAFLLTFAMLLCSICACADRKNKKAIGTMGEYKIPYEQLRFITMTYKAELDVRYGDGDDSNGTIWDDPATAEQYRAELEDLVWSTMRQNYSVLQACAKYGIDKKVFEGKTVQQGTDASLENFIAEYASREEYMRDIESRYATEGVIRFHLSLDEMKYQLYEAMRKEGAFITDEGAFENWLVSGNSAYVQHFLLRLDNDEEKATERARLEDARQKLITGEYTLTDCILNANEDLQNVAPYFLVRGVHQDALVNAAVALEQDGDVSEIVELDGVFYVLVRMDETPRPGINGTVETPMSLKLSQLLSDYQWTIVGDAVAAAEADVKIELNKYGKKIDLLTIS